MHKQHEINKPLLCAYSNALFPIPSPSLPPPPPPPFSSYLNPFPPLSPSPYPVSRKNEASEAQQNNGMCVFMSKTRRGVDHEMIPAKVQSLLKSTGSLKLRSFSFLNLFDSIVIMFPPFIR